MIKVNTNNINSSKVNVSQKVIILDESNRILVLRRTNSAPTRPLFWDLPGGEVEIGEDLKMSILREVKEETQLKIEEPLIFDAIAGFNDIDEYWITICYYTKSLSKKVGLSFEHDKFMWLSFEEFQDIKISSRQQQFIEHFISKRRNNFF